MIENPQVVQTEAQHYAYVHRTVALDGIGAVMGPSIATVVAALQAQAMTPTGPWFTHHLRKPTDFFDFEVCFPVATAIAPSGTGDDVVRAGVWPAMRVARTVYHGDYKDLPHSWGELDAWMKAQGLAGAGEFWEVYTVNPNSDPNPANWRTELNWPLLG